MLGICRHGQPHPHVAEMGTAKRPHEFLPWADYIQLATPLTPETIALFGRRRLRLAKRGAGIVNIGRSAVMEYEALNELLHARHFSGAMLDVFDPEPLPPRSPLWSVSIRPWVRLTRFRLACRLGAG